MVATISCAFSAVDARAAGSLVELVSINSAGTGSGNLKSDITPPHVRASVVSADGRYVVFSSQANNLVPNDNNNKTDVFIRDMTTDTTSLVSVNNTGTGSGNGSSSGGIISANGRFVVFSSSATDVVTSGPNGTGLVIRDLMLGTTILVTVNNTGTGASDLGGHDEVVSADGRYVAFVSQGTNLVNLPDTQDPDVFVRDTVAGTTTMISVNSAGTASANGYGISPSISADGRFVSFESAGTDLTPNDTNGLTDIFVWDRLSGMTEPVSINNAGTGTGNNASSIAVISSNGRYVTFQSQASNLTTNDIDTTPDVFVRDLVADTTTIVSMNSANTSGGNGASLNPSISGDGRFIAFDSLAANLVPNDQNGKRDVFVRDMIANTTALVTVNNNGTSSNSSTDVGDHVISDDGRFVAFVSQARDLVPPYTNNAIANNLFVRDLVASVTTLVSVDSPNNGTGGANSYAPHLSDDGSLIVFESVANNLVSIATHGYSDTNGHLDDIFAAPLEAGTLHFSVSSYSVNEQDATATITVERTGGTSGAVSVDYATSDGTATAGQDYTAVSGTLTFTSGQTTKTFNVPIENDNITESDETVNLSLTLLMNALPSAPSAAVLTIISDDSLPQISIDNVNVTEGNSGISEAVFTVQLTNPSSQTVLVDYATSDGTATANVDYTPASGTLTFTPGQHTRTITVQVFSDTLDEADLTFNVNLNAPTNATIADTQGVGTIIDNDPSPSLRINDVTLTEGNSGTKNLVFTVLASVVSGRDISVHYATANGTAKAGSDYTSTAGTLVIPAGSTSKTIIVSLTGDTLDEANETFFVNLAAPANATIFDGKGTGTITDNDPTPGLRINNASVTEGDGGSINAVFTVTLSAASGQTVKVNYATANGTASAPSDYLAKTGTLTFMPGQTTKTITVAVKGNTAPEPNETFLVNLSGAVNAAITDAKGVGTILNDD